MKTHKITPEISCKDFNMSKERNKAIPAAYLILKKDGEILLMRRQGSGYYDNWYSVPAGHIEAGELPIDGLIREVKEELGIKLFKKDLLFVHSMYRTKHDETGDRVDYFFITSQWSGEIKNTEPHKCDDVRWFSVNALPNKMMHHVHDAIKCINKNIPYSELGLDEITKNPSK